MKRLITFKNNPKIISTATICGPKESRGNLGKFVDKKISDDYNNEKTFELAERKMLTYAVKTLPMGTAYAVWTGMGAAGAVIAGIVLFSEPSTIWHIVFLSMIVIGIVGIKAVS